MRSDPTEEPSATDSWGIKGKRYLITGVGPGVGGHTARTLAMAGANVACCDINPRVSESLVDELGPRIVSLVGDVTKERDVERIVDQATNRLGGPLDGFVDVVGKGHGMDLLDSPIATFDDEVEVNLRQVFLLTRIVGGHLAENPNGGAMALVSSIVAQTSSGFSGVGYAAAKAGVESLVRSAAVQLGPRNVRVNGVALGCVVTDVVRSVWDHETLDGLSAQTPLPYLGEPSNVASTLYYLLSPMSTFVTGQIINIDGGVSRKFGYDLRQASEGRATWRSVYQDSGADT